jgi:hypothetical protein
MVITYEQEEQIIGLYYDNPHLWNPKDKNYKNKQMRQTKLDEFCTILGNISGEFRFNFDCFKK